MNLYILRPIENWKSWYDKCFGVILQAETEEAARKLASECNGDEGPDVWLNPDKTSCNILTAGDKEKVIMIDFAAA